MAWMFSFFLCFPRPYQFFEARDPSPYSNSPGNCSLMDCPFFPASSRLSLLLASCPVTPPGFFSPPPGLEWALQCPDKRGGPFHALSVLCMSMTPFFPNLLRGEFPALSELDVFRPLRPFLFSPRVPTLINLLGFPHFFRNTFREGSPRRTHGFTVS